MRIIPVVDVLGGVAVRAVGGRRGEYRPLRSKLVDSVDPVKVARALLAAAGGTDLYAADLDAIVHADPNTELLAAVADAVPGRLLVDAGLRTRADLGRLPARPRAVPVFGLETLAGPDVLPGDPPAVLSVDLRDGRLIGDLSGWAGRGVPDASAVVELADAAVRLGVRSVILLDLARVGSAGGPGTERFVEALRARHPAGVELLVGGGVRTPDDLRRLEAAGADGVLIASALHDRTLPG